MDPQDPEYWHLRGLTHPDEDDVDTDDDAETENDTETIPLIVEARNYHFYLFLIGMACTESTEDGIQRAIGQRFPGYLTWLCEQFSDSTFTIYWIDNADDVREILVPHEFGPNVEFVRIKDNFQAPRVINMLVDILRDDDSAVYVDHFFSQLSCFHRDLLLLSYVLLVDPTLFPAWKEKVVSIPYCDGSIGRGLCGVDKGKNPLVNGYVAFLFDPKFTWEADQYDMIHEFLADPEERKLVLRHNLIALDLFAYQQGYNQPRFPERLDSMSTCMQQIVHTLSLYRNEIINRVYRIKVSLE